MRRRQGQSLFRPPYAVSKLVVCAGPTNQKEWFDSITAYQKAVRLEEKTADYESADAGPTPARPSNF